MKKFDLEKAIAAWKRSMRKQRGLEPGMIEEIEANLRDRIEEYTEAGKPEEEAYHLACKKAMNSPEEVANEYYKTHDEWEKTPPWKRKNTLYFLLPNYLKVALRNLSNRRFYSVLNYMGLVIGLLCCAIVALYVQYETSWDTFHEKSDRIYRLGQNFRSQGYSVMSYDGYWSAPREVQLEQINGIKEVTGIEDATHFWINGDDAFVEIDEKKMVTDNILSTNTPASFFNMFDWKFLMGSEDMLSSQMYTALLTRSEAEKYFGEQWQEADILGTTIETLDSAYQIVGVLEDIPSNSHYEFNLFLHSNKVPYWGGRTYALLHKDAKAEEVFQRMDDNMQNINKRLASEELFNGTVYQPIEKVHLDSNLLYEMKPPGEIKYLYVFAIISAIILLLTITNYTNLSIALNAGRMREIGMRKVIGASKPGLVLQFLMESLILAFLAIPLVLVLLNLSIKPFNEFMGVELSNFYLEKASYFTLLVCSAIAVGLLAGIYPAFFLSNKSINSLFKVKAMQSEIKGLTIRKLIIAFQFVLLIGLTSFTYLINEQLSYIKNKDVGYNKKGIMYTRVSNENFEEFKRKLKEMPEIKRVGRANPIGRRPFNQTTYRLEGYEDIFDDANNFRMTPEAAEAFGIKTTVPELIANSDSMPGEITLINQTLLNRFKTIYQLDEHDLIGKNIINEPEYTQEDGTIGFPHTIYGFYEDINVFSLREKVEPYFLRINPSFTGGLEVIQFDTEQLPEVLEKVETVYASLGEENPLWYSFMEENLEELYKKEQRVGRLTVYLSLIAFIIAVLGLIALSALLTTMKRKEIGIRKVLGASTLQIIRRFNSEYIKIILIALVLATPLTWFGISKWLENFAFKISISPDVFIGAALFTLLIALLAVSVITYQAAMGSPVKSLKEDQ